MQLEAIKLLLSYSDGKPVTSHVGGPLVNIDLRSGSQHVGPVSPADAARVYREMVAGHVDPLAIEFVAEEEIAAGAIDGETAAARSAESGAPAAPSEAADRRDGAE